MKKKLLLTLITMVVVVFVGCNKGAVSASNSNLDAIKGEPTETNTLTIVHFNDFHGHLPSNDRNEEMGLALMSGYVNQLADQGKQVIILNAGDLIQGSIYTTLTDGEAMVQPINAMNMYAMAVGNHEFDYGLEQALNIQDELNVPMLSANTKYTDDDSLPFTSDLVQEINGIKIGFFGITTPETSYKTHPKNVEDLYFEDIVTAAKSMVEKLQAQNVDAIIAVTHLGIEGSDTSIRMVENVDGIDLVVDGHSHTLYGEKVNDTLIVQAGEYGKYVGTVDLKKEKDGQVRVQDYGLHSFADVVAQGVEADPVVLAAVEQTLAETELKSQEIVASTTIDLDGEREDVRTSQTNLGTLITQALKNSLGADVALFNGGGIRASIPAGDVTYADILTVLPFNNTGVVVEVTGQDIKDALENGVSDFPKAKGAFPHVAGIKVDFNPENAPGERITSITIDGNEIDYDGTYKLATTGFLVAGGDQYTMLTKPIILEGDTAAQILIDYLQQNPQWVEELDN